MAKNLGREFATMTDEERRRFALEQGRTMDPGVEDAAEELDLDDPRDEDRLGRQYGRLADEVASPDERDGSAALLDDDAHRREVEKAAAAHKAKAKGKGRTAR
jgi:hypothetical protein